jgi:seryl-tRNA synthetase
MFDYKFIREHIEEVKEGARLKGETVDLDRWVSRDRDRREVLQELEQLRQKKKEASKIIGRRRGKGEETEVEEENVRVISARINELSVEVKDIEQELMNITTWIPNIPHPDVPPGSDEQGNVEVRTVGELRSFDFAPYNHWQLGEALDILDLGAAARIGGRGFALLTGLGARLQRALISFMLDVHTREHGYKEVSAPYLARSECLFGTGQLPKLAEDMYLLEKDDLFLIPTAEVSLTNMFRDEVIDTEQMPVRMVGQSPCFRREAGSYGRETKGLVRIHQFEKVELVKIVDPESSYHELEMLMSDAEEILQRLGLPYRVVRLCTGELSFAAASCFDLEVWSPAERRWLEVSSCSNFESFQARRMNLRYRPAPGAKLQHPHTLNGSGLALPRTVVALLENYQTPRRTVVVPEELRPYMDGVKEIT